DIPGESAALPTADRRWIGGKTRDCGRTHDCDSYMGGESCAGTIDGREGILRSYRRRDDQAGAAGDVSYTGVDGYLHGSRYIPAQGAALALGDWRGVRGEAVDLQRVYHGHGYRSRVAAGRIARFKRVSRRHSWAHGHS